MLTSADPCWTAPKMSELGLLFSQTCPNAQSFHGKLEFYFAISIDLIM